MTTKLIPRTTKDIAKAASSLCFGQIFSFNSALKLYHWYVTGKGSYSQHMALDAAVDSLLKATDSLVETTISMHGDIEIVIPETCIPDDIIKYTKDFYAYMETQRELFSEAFTQSIIDDYQETVQRLLYKLQRLQ
ncbi:DUF5856 family protein [Dysgonomonas termitidis]|uniref:DUF5856 family protein n=1 Tax=Dysgonomonas termitidis TaxID=1516126 RepID=A0ABV9L3L6_9BACT